MSPRDRSLFRSAAVWLAVLATLASAQQDASFAPDDPAISYSDYACAHIDANRASFDRELVADWICYQEKMSPGVRATFLADASQVRFELDYDFAGFLCGLAPPEPLSWEFGLIIDGVRKPSGSRNPLYPITAGSTPWIHLGAGTGLHHVTLVWPCGADVDLVRLHLKETRDASKPRLLSPAPRDQPVLTIFGDSISQGLNASHVLNTFGVRLGALLNWRVINLGFAGRAVQPLDAWTAAGSYACADGVASAPDLVLLAIGSNDFHFIGTLFTKLDKFEQRYRDWLAQFRSLRPDTPILCLTPLPRGDECQIGTRTLEQYRERIRKILAELHDPRIYLFEGRDLIALPPRAGDPLFDEFLLHPTDAGCDVIAERLRGFNLIRNPNFALLPLAGCKEASGDEPYLWEDGGLEEGRVETGPGGNRLLALDSGARRSQVIHGLSAGDRYTFELSGLLTSPAQAGAVTLAFFDAHDEPVGVPLTLTFTQTTWRRPTRTGTVPDGARYGRLTLAKDSGSGQFLVDDAELTLVGF
jgi:lysophospholipase L1-like esterase